MEEKIKVYLILAVVAAALLGLSACIQAPIVTSEPTVGAAAPTAMSEEATSPSPAEPIAPTVAANTCTDCHLDKEKLIAAAQPEEEIISESLGDGCGGEVAPLEPWEKVLVSEEFLASTHGQMACSYCHAGNDKVEDKKASHTAELIVYPSDAPNQVCGRCHAEIDITAANSLHGDLGGYWTGLEARSIPKNHPALEGMFDNHCASCHASCGDCHVSQPTSVGGGFIDGHLVNKTPSMTRNCTACHGSRVGKEYLGQNEGLPPDVHFRQARFTCVSCHTGAEMHGDYTVDGGMPDHRYDGAQMPECTDCHAEVAAANSGILMHDLHGDKLSCQVCHSVSYSSCDGCHVLVSETSGLPFFETEGTYLTFLIGRNPRISEERPYEYVPLRHVPIAETSFQYYGSNLLPNYDALPTWVYATPHNIQRNTPQTKLCTYCHNNSDVFLTVDKVKADELEANQDVIIESIPPLNFNP